ncbi:hypothetical protein KIW84_012665 [Lathyrus oleraceus]|uniref:Retroviral polymerase SH3-like domain-containing protein n=1 Tax=Pisum sativum TaxID=3888 RepID=A0A9D5GWP3_PEA|nr:hypothetical protein KIW84_012665 [Pisum sativum]
MGLEDTLYGTVRSNLLAQDPLPTLNKVYATLVQEERLREITRVTEERGEAMAFAVHSNFKHKQKGRLCSHCNQTGHDSEGCFQIIGYPKCRGGTAKAHIAQAKGETKEITTEVQEADFGLTSDQLQTLASLLNNVKLGSIEKLNGKCSFLPWIIDTDGKTPFELLYGKPPSLEHLRVIGFLAYEHNQHHKGDKFASRSRKCAFVGYPYGTKGWRMYDLELGVFFNSRDVIFYEDKFLFAAEIIPQQLASKGDHTLPDVSLNNNIVEDDPFQHVVTIPAVPSAPVVKTTRLHDHDRLNGMLPTVPIVSNIESFHLSLMTCHQLLKSMKNHLLLIQSKIWDVAIVSRFLLPSCKTL